jgi:YD repeat-containing protein
MNLKLQNITHLFKNVRTRSIIIVTLLVLFVGLILGVGRLMNKTPAADSSIQLKDSPTLQSIPGGLDKSPSADYQRLQQEQNLQQATLAEKTGASAIPTLLDTSQFNHAQENQMGGSGCRSCCCCEAMNSCASQHFSQLPPGASLLQPSQLRSGTLVYDTQGKVIGRLGSDGKVRNKNGDVIGTVGPDGLVRAADGSVVGSAAVSAVGDPVYDATGHLTGHVDADGKVRDAQGHVIGVVGPDGTVRDLKGGVIGRVASPKLPRHSVGSATVYDEQGHLLGTVGADGKVRDTQGNVIGEVGADGIVRDSSGKMIGKTGAKNAGAPVYDAQGHLLGTVGADGKVRDAKGHVIGEVDAEGILRDAHGKVLGKAINSVGAPVYDAQGHLLGTVGADGKVRDSAGHVIGEVDADGVVHDTNGKILGHAYLGGTTKNPSVIPGAPVYDKQGKLIGTVGVDGRVRDAQGKVLGTLNPDGTLRGPDQQILGRVGATAPGTPIYDRQGRLVGTVGSDGIVRDSEGRAIATLGADGIARDAQGNVLGSTTLPQSTSPVRPNSPNNGSPDQASVSLLPNGTDNPNPELQAILDRQAQQISAQKAEQLQQQMQSSMSTQANQLFVAWGSPTQQYVAGIAPPPGSQLSGSSGIAGSGTSLGSVAPPAVKAGTIMYAVLLTAVNSDEPGPVLAEIVQGKFKGARILGTLSNQGKKVLLSFNTLTLPKLSQSISINTVAIDDSTARTALSSYTNNHYWLRYGTLFASAFLQGYGQSFLNAGSPFSGAVIINPNVQPQPNLKPRERVFVGLGQVGLQYASALGSIFSTPPTVHVYSGTPMGILFLSDLAALPPE